MIRLKAFALSILFWLATLGGTTHAQNQHHADSLIQVIASQSLADEDLITLYIAIGNEHPDASIALENSYKALSLAKKSQKNKAIIQAYELISSNERLLGNYVKATDFGLQALTLAKLIEDEAMQASILAELGNNAVSDGNYDLAIDCFHQAELIYKKTQKHFHLSLTAINLGESYRLAEDYDSAIFYFNKALTLNDTLSDPIIGSYALGNLGMALRSQKRLIEARSALKQSLTLVEELGDPYTQSVYMADLGLIDLEEKQYAAAESNLQNALQIAKENGLKEQIRDISAMLVTYYSSTRDFERALTYQMKFQAYQDSLINKENIQQIERLKANFAITSKEAEIDHLNQINQQQANEKLLILIALIGFLTLSTLLFRTNKKTKIANASLAKREEEKALLLKELNHRVKNNLQMISSLMNLQCHTLKGHPAEAAILAGKLRVDAMALIHQKLYQEDVHTTIEISELIKKLVDNLLFGVPQPINTEINLARIHILIEQAIPIALIINELTTNAIKYAFDDITHPTIYLDLYQKENTVLLGFGDNGVGTETIKIDSNQSFGITLIRSLVKQLHGHITQTTAKGTHWELSFPIHQNSQP